ncbi:hypothetical protein QJS10_CPA02g01296 [Acorus calamus]|uniref:DUF7906 domain-containing protein n=1 Tax=Acorus calamus TaxID=4465 RepID=A0AAV9FH13_ACOCL|nr:hypothetical protein QJS10_CPA02g01296 [Acorus calamus]
MVVVDPLVSAIREVSESEIKFLKEAEWSNMCLGYLNNIENFYKGKDNAEIIYNKAVQMFHGKDDDMRTLLEKELKSGDLAGLHHECLTDTRIGRDKLAFIDLTAGPFSWGPAVGGEGVRTAHSLPNVGKTIGAVKAQLITINCVYSVISFVKFKKFIDYVGAILQGFVDRPCKRFWEQVRLIKELYAYVEIVLNLLPILQEFFPLLKDD